MRRHVPVERHSASDADQQERCQAGVTYPPWHLHVYQCKNKAKHQVGDFCLCGVHVKIARQWESEGVLEDAAKYHWRYK